MDQYLRLNCKGVRQLELFCDESVKAIYEDGSVIQLSSCGSVFRYCRQGSEETTIQHVDYCISKHKEDVCTLVRFRNLWAEKAFVPFVDVAMVISPILIIVTVCHVSHQHHQHQHHVAPQICISHTLCSGTEGIVAREYNTQHCYLRKRK